MKNPSPNTDGQLSYVCPGAPPSVQLPAASLMGRYAREREEVER
ncbi:MAG: hypothetical protein Q8N79_03500 [Candidatus Methanoperedens sp.]|nr:hypothetical protein [Candidatus Methanoperedens sp.]